MNMTDKERGHNIQFLILPSTIAVVDKGTSLHCYNVKMCRTGVTNSSEGMFLCLPEEMYILSTFFVRHIHSEYK